MSPLKCLFRRLLLQRMRTSGERDPALAALTVTTMLVVCNVISVVALVRAGWNPEGQHQEQKPERALFDLGIDPVMGGIQGASKRAWKAQDQVSIEGSGLGNGRDGHSHARDSNG
jgi:hypothetical protein